MPAGEPLRHDAQNRCASDENRGVDSAVEPRIGVQALLEAGGGLAEAGDRVEAAGIADEPVGREAEKETDCP